MLKTKALSRRTPHISQTNLIKAYLAYISTLHSKLIYSRNNPRKHLGVSP